MSKIDIDNTKAIMESTFKDGDLVTSIRLRDAPQYKQVIGNIEGPVRDGVVTIRMLHVLRNWNNDNNRPDAAFVPASQIPMLVTSALVGDVNLISQEQMLALVQRPVAEVVTPPASRPTRRP